MFPLELISEGGSDFSSINGGYHLKPAEIAPLSDPALKNSDILTAHQLEATGEIGGHPAIDKLQPVRQLPASLAKSAINRLGVMPERFNYHEQHGCALTDMFYSSSSSHIRQTQAAAQPIEHAVGERRLLAGEKSVRDRDVFA